MNQLDTTLSAATPLDSGVRVLLPERLENWSAEDFALAIALARAPATLSSGLGEALLHLTVADGSQEKIVASVPLDVDGNALTLGLGNRGLDALASLLGDDASGAALSLDAIEALTVAVLSPLARTSVGRASWGAPGRSIAALTLGEASLSLTGAPAAILALQTDSVAASASLASPFALMGGPLAQRLAVSTEQLLGLVRINDAERACMEEGCGILLDTIWPSSKQVAGRRFVKADSGWHVDHDLVGSMLRIRASEQVQMLDELALDGQERQPSPTDLDLVDGDDVIATGHLIALELSGKPAIMFEVDHLV